MKRRIVSVLIRKSDTCFPLIPIAYYPLWSDESRMEVFMKECKKHADGMFFPCQLWRYYGTFIIYFRICDRGTSG